MINQAFKNLRTIKQSIILIGILSVFIGCSKDTQEVKIGIAGPFTGAQAKIGSDMAQGAEMAIEEWNAKGGVLGKKILAVRGDDEASPKQATAIAQDLAAKKVAGVVGHFNSGCTIPASEVYNDKEIVVITPGSTNPKVTDRSYTGVFRVCGRDDQQGSVAAEFALSQLNAKRVAILHDKTTYGQGLADEFAKTLKSKGIEAVYYAGVPKEELDFRAVISAIKESKPDVWFFGGIYDQGGPLLNQARQSGLTAPLISGDGLIDKEFIKTAGKNAEGVYLTFGPDPKKVPSATEFLAKYGKKYGEAGPYSVYGYDSANILLTAIEKTGSTQFEKTSAFIHNNKFNSAMGPLEFDAKGDIKGTYYVIWTVKDGEFVVLEKK
jgi:branched-chain amino acid transport system substrate-binding protein